MNINTTIVSLFLDYEEVIYLKIFEHLLIATYSLYLIWFISEGLISQKHLIGSFLKKLLIVRTFIIGFW